MTPICLLTLLLTAISAVARSQSYSNVAEMKAAFAACRLNAVHAQSLLEELEAAARARLTPPPEQLRFAIADAVAGQSGSPERLAAAERFFELSPESVRATCQIRAVAARHARALSVAHTGAAVLSPGSLADLPPIPRRMPAQTPKPPMPTPEQLALRQHLSDLKLTVPPFHRNLPPAALAERSLNTALEGFAAKHGRLPNDAEFQELYERAFGAEGSPLRAALDVALREEFHAGQKQVLQIATIVGIPGMACALIAEGYVTGWTKTAAWVNCTLPPVFWTARAAGFSLGRIMGVAARGVEWIMKRGKPFAPAARAAPPGGALGPKGGGVGRGPLNGS